MDVMDQRTKVMELKEMVPAVAATMVVIHIQMVVRKQIPLDMVDHLGLMKMK